jgi:hypothetical protein
MNRIYKVIWSKVKHQYVVVSELAHRDGKQSKSERSLMGTSLRAIIAAFVVTGAMCGMPCTTTLAADVSDGQGNSGTYEETAPTFDANSKNNVSNGEGNTFTYANENEVKGDLNTLKGEDGKTTDKNTVQGDSNILTSSSNNIVNGGITNKLGSGETARFDGGNELTSSNDNTITGDNNTLDSSSGNSIIGGKAELVGHGAEYRAEGGNTLTNSNTNNIQGEQNKLTNADNNTIVGGTLVVKNNYNGAVEGGNELRNAANNSITGDKNRIFESNNNIITGDSNEIGEWANNPYNDPDIELGINLDSNIIEGSSNKIHNGSNNTIEGDGNNVGRKDYDPSSENDIMGNTNTLYAASQNNITGNSNRLTNASNNEVYGNSNVLNNGYNASSKADNNHIWGDNNELQHTIDTWILGSNNKLGTTSKDSQNNFIIGNSNTFGRDGNTYAVTNSLVFGNNNKTGDGLINSTLIGSNMQLGKLTAGTGGSDIKNSVVIGQDIVAPLGSEFMLIGSNINAESANKAVVVGANTGTVKERSTILGYETSADEGAVAIGLKASAIGDNSVAIGPQARTTEWNSVAIGYNSGTGEGSSYAIALGRSTAVAKDSQSAIAIGSYAYVGEGATSSIAIGANGRWGGSEGNPGATWSEDHSGVGDGSYQSIAMGSAAVVGAKAQNSIAIGGLDTLSGQYDPSDGIETVNVGSGSVNATVVGVDSFVGKNSTFGTVYGSKAKIDDNVDYATAIGSEAFVSGSNSLAAGYQAKALADNSVAIGKDSLVTNKKSDGTDRIEAGTTITTENSIAIGAGSKVTADDIFTADDLVDFKDALGANYTESYNIKASDISKAGVFSVGSKDSERRIINVARGRISEDSTDAVNGSQLYGLASDLNQKIEKAGGDWTLTTNGGPNDTEKTTVGKGDVVDFSGAKDETTQHQNIQISQEQTTDAEGNVTGTKVAVDLNDRVELGTGDDQIVIDATADAGNLFIGKNIQMNASGSATFGGIKLNQDQDVNDNPEHGSTITGLTNKTWNQNGTYNAGRAATEEQLQAAIGNVTANTYQGWNVTTNGIAKSSKTISSNNTVDFAGKVDESGHSNIVVSKEDAKDGTNLKFDLNDKVLLGEDEENQIILDGTKGNVSIGDVSVNNGTGISFMADGSATFGKIQINKEEKGSTIIGLTNTTWTPNGTYNAGRAATEEQLQQAINNSEMNFQQNDQHLVKNPGTQDGHYFVDGKNQVNLQVQKGVDENGNPQYDTVTIDNVAQASDVGNVSDLNEGVLNEDGSHTTVVDAINNIDDRVTNIEGDIVDLGGRIDKVEATAGKHSSVSNTDGNITVDDTGKNEAGGVDYVVGLNNEKITVGNETNNVTIEGNKGSISVTNSVSAGQTTISNEGVSVGGNTYITDKGINANNQVITNVAAGKDDTDAVNVSQLKGVEQRVENNSMAITNIGNKVGELDSRIDEVGAGAAALAALHPLDFDPDDKWDFSAGYGNYRGENAVAIGAFYRPNEDTMFSVGGTVGNGDNMVNAGVSFKIGQGNNVSTSRVAMAKEIKSMRDIVAKQDAQIQKLTAMVNALVGMEAIAPDTTTMFPDVPENHWAYEAVETMAKTGLVQGYPDGEFKGDRNMTRYEFAQIVYNAIQAGIKVDERLVQEFRPELEYFRIDTISKDKDGNPVIQRVRTNDVPVQQ